MTKFLLVYTHLLAQVDVFVDSVNDRPVITAGSHSVYDSYQNVETDQLSKVQIATLTLECEENTACPISDLSVRDVDAAETKGGYILIKFETLHGTISLDSSITSNIESNELFSLASVLEAQMYVPCTMLTTALDGIVYTPPVDFHGSDSIVITVNDLGNSGLCYDKELVGYTCNLIATYTLPVNIAAKEDRLEFISPYDNLLVIAVEDQEVVLRNISVLNHDFNFFHVPEEDPRFIERDSSVNRNPVTNDFESNRIMNSTNYTNEAGSRYGLVNETFVDHPWPQVVYDPAKTFTFELISAKGAVSLVQTEACNYSIGDGILDTHVKFEATIGTMNRAISTIRFLPMKEYNTWDNGDIAEIKMIVSDAVSARATHTIHVAIEPKSDMPVLRLPGEVLSPIVSSDVNNLEVSGVSTVFLDEDEKYSLAGVSIGGVDAVRSGANSQASLVITTYHGTLSSDDEAVSLSFIKTSTVTSPAASRYVARNSFNADVRDVNTNDFDYNITYTGYNYNGSMVLSRRYTLHGSTHHLNLALKSLIYIPNENYFGNETIDFLYCDGGRVLVSVTGISAQDPMCVTRGLPIYLYRVNDPPVWTVPQPIAVAEDSQYSFGTLISLEDVDSFDTPLQVTITADVGTLSLQHVPASLALIDCTGENDPALKFTGTLAAINSALTNLIYTPRPFWNSKAAGKPDILRMIATDSGTTNQETSNPNTFSELMNLTTTADVLIVVEHTLMHRPRFTLPGATYRTYPCEQLSDRMRSDRGQYYGEQECQRILAVEVFDVFEDTLTEIPDISIVNDDATELSNRFLELTVVCLHGSIGVKSASQFGVQTVQAGVNNSFITLRGAQGPLNAVLASLSYTPRKNFFGSDSLSLYMKYFGEVMVQSKQVEHWHNESIPIQVLSVDDIPLVHIPLNYLEVLEDSLTPIPDIYIESDDFIEIFRGPYSNSFISNPLQSPEIVGKSNGMLTGIAMDMPLLTSTMKEGRIWKWRKNVGDKVNVGDSLYSVDIWPDHLHMDISSTVEGFLAVIATPEHHVALVGAQIAMFVEDHTHLDYATASVPVPTYNNTEHLGVLSVDSAWDYSV